MAILVGTWHRCRLVPVPPRDALQSASSWEEVEGTRLSPAAWGWTSRRGRPSQPRVHSSSCGKGEYFGSVAMNLGSSCGFRGEGIKHFEKLAKVPLGALRWFPQTRRCFSLPSEVTIHGVCRCRHCRSLLRVMPRCASPQPCTKAAERLGGPLNPCSQPWAPIPALLPRAACSFFPRSGFSPLRQVPACGEGWGRLGAVGVSSASRHRCCICSHNSSASPSRFCPEKLGRSHAAHVS